MITNQVRKQVQDLLPTLINWRRDFHRYPEVGWTEYRTASIVASNLSKLGFTVNVGPEVINDNERMGVPSPSELSLNEKRAIDQGAVPFWVQKMKGGYTGVVGMLESKKSGPTMAIRVDMDALEITETCSENHFPNIVKFQSHNKGKMHACGHDAHTSIGLGVASILSRFKEHLPGNIKIIFQPAEEGVRGAKSMVKAGILDDVDIFFAVHLGLGVPSGEIVCGAHGFLATTKLDVSFHGKGAHAGANPEQGKNALLAASNAVLNLHAITRHGDGPSRINVGNLQAESGRNVVPDTANMKLETRGATTEINKFITDAAYRIIEASSQMYDVDYKIVKVGEALGCNSSVNMIGFIKEQAKHLKAVINIKDNDVVFVSEDATYMMQYIQEKKGEAAYVIIGSDLTAGHHNEKFDIDERDMGTAVELLSLCAINYKVYRVEAANKNKPLV